MVRINRSEAMSKKGARILKDAVYSLLCTLAVFFSFFFLSLSTEPSAIWPVLFLAFLMLIGASRVIY